MAPGQIRGSVPKPSRHHRSSTTIRSSGRGGAAEQSVCTRGHYPCLLRAAVGVGSDQRAGAGDCAGDQPTVGQSEGGAVREAASAADCGVDEGRACQAGESRGGVCADRQAANGENSLQSRPAHQARHHPDPLPHPCHCGTSHLTNPSSAPSASICPHREECEIGRQGVCHTQWSWHLSFPHQRDMCSGASRDRPISHLPVAAGYRAHADDEPRPLQPPHLYLPVHLRAGVVCLT